MAQPRYLTESRFKLAMECPAKLYYTGKRDRYPDTRQQDSFVAALAEGGYPVGLVAKLYFPGGTDIRATDHEAALAQTNRRLDQPDAVTYEAAMRIDMLAKSGRKLKLIEVKSKSCDPRERSPIFGRRNGTIRSRWRPMAGEG